MSHSKKFDSGTELYCISAEFAGKLQAFKKASSLIDLGIQALDYEASSHINLGYAMLH